MTAHRTRVSLPAELLVYAGASGHMEEIQPLVDVLRERFRLLILTNKTDFTSSLPHVTFVRDFGPGLFNQALGVVEAAIVAYRALSQTGAKVVIATGPLPGLGVLIAARMCGRRAVFLDTLCRFSNLSAPGRLASFLAGRNLVQWPHLLSKAGRNGVYWGQVL